MPKPTKNGIILRVDPDQKGRAMIGGTEIMVATKYKTNNRDKSPVIGIVEVGNGKIKPGSPLIVHHNLFYGENSVYSMGDGLFSIPANENIFLRIDDQGRPHSMFGNIICERIWKESSVEIPDAHKQVYLDRVRVISNGYGYKKGQIVFNQPYYNYEIIYNWGNIEHHVVKVKKADIVAVLIQ